MEISKSSLSYKIFQWWDSMKDYTPYKFQHNLCPYMRAVLFYSWARYLFIKHAKYSWPTLVVLGHAITRYFTKNGFWNLLKAEGMIALMLAGITAIGLGIYYTLQNDKIEEFGDTIIDYVQAKHDKVCPEIKFVD